MKKRLLLIILATFFLASVMIGAPTDAKSYTAEQLVVQAEKYANQLKSQVYFGKPKRLGLVSSSLISKTLAAKKQASVSVKKVKSTSSRKKLEARLKNVELIYSRTLSYNAAILQGQKLKSKTQELLTIHQKYSISYPTEQYGRLVQTELNKFNALTNKVYGQANRTALMHTYKAPVEEALIQTKNVISVSKDKMIVNFNVIEAVSHPTKPIIYALTTEKDLIEMNLQTMKIRKMTFSLPPERLYFANNELYITLLKGQHSSYWWDEGQKGAFVIVNTDSFKLTKVVDILLDPYDIVADSKFIYISSGSGQWTNLKVYSRRTLLEVDKGNMIREASFLEMHPSGGKLYAIDKGTSPRDVETYQFIDGKKQASYDSPYHGDYPLKSNMNLSPDGKYIFNGSGIVFQSSFVRESDMNYVTTLNNPYEEIVFNVKSNRLYTSSKKRLDIYEYSTLEYLKQYELEHEIDFMFVQGDELVVIYKETPPGTLLPKQVVKKYSLTNQGTLIF